MRYLIILDLAQFYNSIIWRNWKALQIKAKNLIFIKYSFVRLIIEEQEIIHLYSSYKYQAQILK